MLTATVSGSFHRHMQAIYESVGELRERGINVLSPADPRIVDNLGEFLFVASDRLRSVRLVQDRHLAAINASDFLWVVCPDGYTGPSTCMEIGAAISGGVPVFSSSPALDVTIGEYVKQVSSVSAAIEWVRRSKKDRGVPSVLLEPRSGIDRTFDVLADLRPVLLGEIGDGRSDAELQFVKAQRFLRKTFGL